jgi:hypothetical protein
LGRKLLSEVAFMQAGNVQKQVKNGLLLKSYYLGQVYALQIAEYVLF